MKPNESMAGMNAWTRTKRVFLKKHIMWERAQFYLYGVERRPRDWCVLCDVSPAAGQDGVHGGDAVGGGLIGKKRGKMKELVLL